MLVTSAGLAGAGGHDRGSRTIGRGLSESRSSGSVRIETQYMGILRTEEDNVLMYLIFYRS